MKKMLALFLALILSLSSIGAFAEEDAFTCTVDFELALEELMNMAGAAMDDEALGASISMLLPLINKMDLLSFTNFDPELFTRDVQSLNANAKVIPCSATTGLGMEEGRKILGV